MLVALGLILAGAAVLLVHQLGPRPPSWYPPCLFHQATGLFCPGCGSARAVHALGHGSIGRAIDQNLLTVAMIPVLLAWSVVVARRLWLGGRFSASLPGGWAAGVLVAVVVFTLLRNLPWWPFLLLAPE